MLKGRTFEIKNTGLRIQIKIIVHFKTRFKSEPPFKKKFFFCCTGYHMK